MELEQITMPRAEARRAFLDYKRDVTAKAATALGEAERRYHDLDDGMLRAYRALASGRAVIRLSEAIRQGGVERRSLKWAGQDVELALPKIACIRADATRVVTTGVRAEGQVTFYAGPLTRWNDPPSRAKRNLVGIPDGTFPDEDRGPRWPRVYGVAVVPTIPPPLRPSRGIGSYHLLWEADWDELVPVDPALIKHLGGDLYAVVAIWDLTDLERAVLGQAG